MNKIKIRKSISDSVFCLIAGFFIFNFSLSIYNEINLYLTQKDEINENTQTLIDLNTEKNEKEAELKLFEDEDYRLRYLKGNFNYIDKDEQVFVILGEQE